MKIQEFRGIIQGMGYILQSTTEETNLRTLNNNGWQFVEYSAEHPLNDIYEYAISRHLLPRSGWGQTSTVEIPVLLKKRKEVNENG